MYQLPVADRIEVHKVYHVTTCQSPACVSTAVHCVCVVMLFVRLPVI